MPKPHQTTADPHAQSKEMQERILERRARIEKLTEMRAGIDEKAGKMRQEISKLLVDGEDKAVSDIRKDLAPLAAEAEEVGRAIVQLGEECAHLEEQTKSVLAREHLAIYNAKGALALETADELTRKIEEFRDTVLSDLSRKMRTAMIEANASYYQAGRLTGNTGAPTRLNPSPWLSAVERAVIDFKPDVPHGDGGRDFSDGRRGLKISDFVASAD